VEGKGHNLRGGVSKGGLHSDEVRRRESRISKSLSTLNERQTLLKTGNLGSYRIQPERHRVQFLSLPEQMDTTLVRAEVYM